jgi:hypothetical protein
MMRTAAWNRIFVLAVVFYSGCDKPANDPGPEAPAEAPTEVSEALLNSLDGMKEGSGEVGPVCERYSACCNSYADSLDEKDGVNESHKELIRKSCDVSRSKGEQWCQEAMEGMSLANSRFGASNPAIWPEDCIVGFENAQQ